MASLCNDPNGRRRITFIDSNGKRKTIRLGKVALRYAQTFKVKLEDLVSAKITGYSPSDDTSRWLSELDDVYVEKLSKVGLVKARNKSTLQAFVDEYIRSRTDIKPSTLLVYNRARKHLLGFFDADKPLRDFTSVDADDWRRYLLEKGLAENTIRRSCGMAKQWFAVAVKGKLIAENPFGDLKVAIKGNAKKLYYIKEEDAQKVIEVCPDYQWRLLFAMARYGGLRVPSEVLLLRWEDIDWENSRFTVTSPKTEHHEGHESRVVPIFPELYQYLRDAYEMAEEGDEYCITRYRDTTVNLRTQLQRIIKRAGLNPWPRLWQNLRSTRETELADKFPVHVVSAWIGNSVPVAIKHYLQVTDEHYDKAARNAAQKVSETVGNDKKLEIDKKIKNDISVGSCESLHKKTASCKKQEAVEDGRYRTRTCDFFLVREAL